MGLAFNLLTEPLIQTTPCGKLTLPGVLAALARDEIESFPALRPHQSMFWHMFLVQLGAVALHRAEQSEIPLMDAAWGDLLRGLTPAYRDDEPWCLVVSDWSKPAFMQPPVPNGLNLANDVPTADSLDLLITAKNHDLKRAVSRKGNPQDWVFALISLQTGEGYGGAGNQGIARMNGGSSSRAILTLAPLPQENQRVMSPRPGAWTRREISVLLETRRKVLHDNRLEYADDGLALTWLAPWREGEQLQIDELDIWFIEVCRRIRFTFKSSRIQAVRGTSKATRINAKHLNGVLCDPWAPVHKTDRRSLTLGEDGDFHYATLTNLLLSGDWEAPLLARPASFENPNSRMTLMANAIARGNSKTGGLRSRSIPISGKALLSLGARPAALHELARAQAATISVFAKAISYALALAVAKGEKENIKKELYSYAQSARNSLDQFADSIFFEHLWRRLDAQEQGQAALRSERGEFERRLWQRTQQVFDQFLPTMPCPSLFRHRAEARARRALTSIIRKHYPELFERQPEEKEAADAAGL